MPEAAEVDVAAAQLAHVVVGRVLLDLAITHPRTARAQPVTELQRFVGARVGSVARHGKWILVGFDDVVPRIGLHLRMSGQLLARPQDDVTSDRHVHGRLRFGPRSGRPPAILGAPGPPPGGAGRDGRVGFDLWFRDPRTFGELRVLDGGAPVTVDLYDADLTATTLASAARRRRVGVKAVLLDQTGTMSGIGSYLADEALHRAGIAPTTSAASLSVSAWTRILDAARQIAAASAQVGGVTLADEGWVDLWGRPGGYGAQLRVHGRTDCASCGATTRRAVVGGRSARWCPRCQDARRRR